MAYIFDLETVDFRATPFVDTSGTSVIDFALGYNPEANTVVLMSVMLVAGESYLEGKLPDIRDLQFGIRVRNLAHDTISPPDFSSTSAGLFIPNDARQLVLANIHYVIIALLRYSWPPYLTMETYYPNLPDKALQKYGTIAALITGAYDLLDRFRDEASGIDYWFFGRDSTRPNARLEPGDAKD